MRLSINSPKQTARRYSIARLGVTCCLASSVLFAAEPAPSQPASAGEKIQFSDPQDDFQIPAQDSNDPLSKKSFESLNRQSSVSGVIAPDLALPARPAPNGTVNGRLLELYQRRLDEKRNWIYQRPGDADAQPSMEEMFGVRDPTRAGGLRSRSVLEEYFDGPARKPSASQPTEASRDSLDRTGLINSWQTGSRSSNPGPGSQHLVDTTEAGHNENPLVWGNLNKPGFSVQNGFVVPDPIRPDASLDPTFRLSHKRDADQSSRSEEFRKLLVIQNGINPLAAGFDPINVGGDSTRQNVNPIMPVGLDPSLVGAGILAGTGASPAAAAGHGGLALESGPALAGSSSLTPVLPTPSASPRPLRQPIVLEIPRRRF